MRSITFVIFTFVMTSTNAGQSKFEEHEIVPNIIDKAPPGVIDITYEGGEKVNLGSPLTPTQVQNKPKFSWDHEDGALYTLVFVDPDVPSRTKPRGPQFLHGLIANIPGDNVDSGLEQFGYMGSGPPKGSGLHRYIFLVYKQPGKLSFPNPPASSTSIEGRSTFNVKEWAASQGLGQPVAGNFYQAEWDEYVPILYKKLGFN